MSDQQEQEARSKQIGNGNQLVQTQRHQPITLEVTIAAPNKAPWVSIHSVRLQVVLSNQEAL